MFLSFGSFDEKRVIAQVVKSKALVQIGTGVLPLAALKPVEFKFRLAHEMAHLAANDYRSDRIVRNHYVCFAVCAGASLAAALESYVEFAIHAVRSLMNPDIITTAGPRFFVHLALSALAASLLFGVVSMLLFAERRATRRARELLADGSRMSPDL
jgi:Zn-dependent protease with chaperone function